jgi:hypothetical protein
MKWQVVKKKIIAEKPRPVCGELHYLTGLCGRFIDNIIF